MLLCMHVYLILLYQAIGAGGQGWTNAILYIFFSPKIRQRLLCCFSTKCKGCQKTKKTSRTHFTSSNYCSPPLESISTESFVRDWNVV